MPGGAGHLDALRVARPAILQHPPHGDAERVLVNARPLAVAAEAEQLGALGFRRAATGEPVAALHGNLGSGSEGFHVVNYGRFVQITVGGRKRRANARYAVLALQRFDQRRFFATNVGSGTHVDIDVEIEARIAQDRLAEQTDLAAALQSRFERVQHVAILATQIDEPVLSTDNPAAQGHAFEHQISEILHQHPVLESAWFAFIGIANYIFYVARGVAAGNPLGG